VLHHSKALWLEVWNPALETLETLETLVGVVKVMKTALEEEHEHFPD